MNKKIRKIKSTLKNILGVIIRSIQKILMSILLTILYIFGFGITLMFLLIFNRKFLRRKSLKEDTWWENAVGYGMDPQSIVRQS